MHTQFDRALHRRPGQLHGAGAVDGSEVEARAIAERIERDVGAPLPERRHQARLVEPFCQHVRAEGQEDLAVGAERAAERPEHAHVGMGVVATDRRERVHRRQRGVPRREHRWVLHAQTFAQQPHRQEQAGGERAELVRRHRTGVQIDDLGAVQPRHRERDLPQLAVADEREAALLRRLAREQPGVLEAPQRTQQRETQQRALGAAHLGADDEQRVADHAAHPVADRRLGLVVGHDDEVDAGIATSSLDLLDRAVGVVRQVAVAVHDALAVDERRAGDGPRWMRPRRRYRKHRGQRRARTEQEQQRRPCTLQQCETGHVASIVARRLRPRHSSALQPNVAGRVIRR